MAHMGVRSPHVGYSVPTVCLQCGLLHCGLAAVWASYSVGHGVESLRVRLCGYWRIPVQTDEPRCV